MTTQQEYLNKITKLYFQELNGRSEKTDGSEKYVGQFTQQFDSVRGQATNFRELGNQAVIPAEHIFDIEYSIGDVPDGINTFLDSLHAEIQRMSQEIASSQGDGTYRINVKVQK